MSSFRFSAPPLFLCRFELGLGIPLYLRPEGYFQSRFIWMKPEGGNILNLVFIWAEDGTELKVDLPIVYTGEDVCADLKKGGSLSWIRTSLKYLSPADQIPSQIEVDLSNLDIGDKVLLHDVVVHPSFKFLSKNESMPICKIMEDYGDQHRKRGICIVQSGICSWDAKICLETVQDQWEQTKKKRLACLSRLYHGDIHINLIKFLKFFASHEAD